METAASEIENVKIVDRCRQAMNSRDRRLLEETVAVDFVRHCQATPHVQVRCLDDFWNYLQRDWQVFPDAKIVPQQAVAQGDRVAVYATYEGTQLGPMGPFSAISWRTSSATFCWARTATVRRES